MVGEWIRQQILQEVQRARLFSLCADKAADCSNKEQLPLVLRFMDSTNSIGEEFVDFILCDTGTSGSAVASKILEALEGHYWSWEYCWKIQRCYCNHPVNLSEGTMCSSVSTSA